MRVIPRRTPWMEKIHRFFRGRQTPRFDLTPDTVRLIQAVRERRLTYCGPPKLEIVCESIERLRQRQIQGCFVEAGCALGGSAILIASLKPQDAAFYVYDVFGMIPAPTPADGPDSHARYAEIVSGASNGIQGDTYYGYLPDLRQVVERNLQSFDLDLAQRRIELVEGLFEETLHVAEPVAFAHIDCDWYDSVRVCIERLAPHVVPNGLVVFDDYSSYSGCRRAVDEWLASCSDFRLARVERSATIERIWQ